MSRTLPAETVDTPVEFQLIMGAKWSLKSQASTDKTWSLVVVYRGYHCPVCKKQLKTLSGQLSDFAEAGVAVVAVSMDSEERASKAYDEWALGDLPVGYGLSKEFAKTYGLYLSESIKDDEPKLFTEPALLLFRGETLHAAWLQSLPFARPAFDELLSGIKYIDKEDYPARGDVRP